MVEWLFGTFAAAGIQMPASFDVAGVFDLTCQVLGLTWPRLRVKVVKIIGEENTERLELVAQYVEALVTGGFAGLWEKVQQDMQGLWEMVIGGAKQWLMEKLVQQAILKIATMWNPAGAIIQLIQTAWNVYCWVKENAQRIFGLVQAVVDSISNIANGNISGAANYIEASLAKLVPIAISLFANLLGLGGIADKIKEIITKVQTKVDQAIDKLIDRVMKMFKGKGKGKDDKAADGKGGDGKGEAGKDGDKKEDENKPVGARITFRVGSATHTQYLDKGVPMVASTPTGVKAKIEEWRPKLKELPEADRKKAGGPARQGGEPREAGRQAGQGRQERQEQGADSRGQAARAGRRARPGVGAGGARPRPGQAVRRAGPGGDPQVRRVQAVQEPLPEAGGGSRHAGRRRQGAGDLAQDGHRAAEDRRRLQGGAGGLAGQPPQGPGLRRLPEDHGRIQPDPQRAEPVHGEVLPGQEDLGLLVGKPAMALAKKAAEVCLEKSALGGLFDNLNINGNWDTQMWASLSKAYATHAAAQFNGAKYTGFVGMGSSADQSIFNKIEQPQFASMLSEKQKIDLKIDWYAAAGDPKTKMNEPDERFEASGVKGVYAKGERAAMVDKAETEKTETESVAERASAAASGSRPSTCQVETGSGLVSSVMSSFRVTSLSLRRRASVSGEASFNRGSGTRVLAMKLIWCEASTLSGEQARYQPMMPCGESPLAVGRYSSRGRGLPVSSAM
ncbi:MAG: hypothetical protein HC793_02470 [Aquincola sp.]|nr:hypothetical protein [Aquincola sp.]